MHFFHVFSLPVRIAALYFCRLFRKTFCVLSLVSKPRVFFGLLLHRHIYFFIFVRSEVHHIISRHSFIYILESVLSQVLVIQFSLFSFAYRQLVLASMSNSIMLWSLLISLGTTFQFIFLSLSIPFSVVISMLDLLPMYPWYVNGHPDSFAIWNPRFHNVSSTISPFCSVIEENLRFDFTFTSAQYTMLYCCAKRRILLS